MKIYVKSNTFSPNTDMSVVDNQFPEFLGKIEDKFAEFVHDSGLSNMRVSGTRFVDSEMITYELILFKDGNDEVGTVNLVYMPDDDNPRYSFAAFDDDSDSAFAHGKSFDDMVDPCFEKLCEFASNDSQLFVYELCDGSGTPLNDYIDEYQFDTIEDAKRAAQDLIDSGEYDVVECVKEYYTVDSLGYYDMVGSEQAFRLTAE